LTQKKEKEINRMQSAEQRENQQSEERQVKNIYPNL
jgi:hypothetical protein